MEVLIHRREKQSRDECKRVLSAPPSIALEDSFTFNPRNGPTLLL